MEWKEYTSFCYFFGLFSFLSLRLQFSGHCAVPSSVCARWPPGGSGMQTVHIQVPRWLTRHDVTFPVMR